jgi:hypothetical protein
MATINVGFDSLGNTLREIMLAPDITPGDAVSYQTCKQLFLWHPLGFKMVCAPLQLALAEGRDISVPNSPGERCTDAFKAQWAEINADAYIFQTAAMARTYGISSLGMLVDGEESSNQLRPWELPDANISFNVYDPLNTSGSLVLNQNPMAMNFMKVQEISVQGNQFHRSKAVTIMNEFPVYIAYSSSAFGFVGRSVFQRALYPMKSFLKTMIADDLIETKVGVLVSKTKPSGSIANQIMRAAFADKRNVVKEAETGNVINVSIDESVESLNLQNMDAPHALARRNILENIATSADMPIKLLAQEAFVEGFGEGTEDAKAIARYIDRLRYSLDPLFKFFDLIAMHRAWTEEFFKDIQKDFPNTYGQMSYKEAFYMWKNSFTASWPSMLKEPESELARLEDIKLKAVIALIQVFEPVLDLENKIALYQWATDNISSNRTMFISPLEFDFDALTANLEDQQAQQEEQAKAQMEAMRPGGEEEPEGQGGRVKMRMGQADSLAARFDKAAKILGDFPPQVAAAFPLDKLRGKLGQSK